MWLCPWEGICPTLAFLGMAFTCWEVICEPAWPLHRGDTTASSASSRDSNTGWELPPQGPGALSTWEQGADLGMGWDVGTTGTNLGQVAICSWTFMQEETCTLILASVT